MAMLCMRPLCFLPGPSDFLPEAEEDLASPWPKKGIASWSFWTFSFMSVLLDTTGARRRSLLLCYQHGAN